MKRRLWCAAPLAALAMLAALGASCLGAGATSRQLLAEAKDHFDRGEYARARRLAQRVVKADPTSPVALEAWLLVVDCYMKEDEPLKAYQECERLLSAHPRTKYRSAIIKREFTIGRQICLSRARKGLFGLAGAQEGIEILNKVVERAPFGPLADDAVFTIGEAYFIGGDYEAARDQFDHLIKNYPRSELAIRARVRRAYCNARLVEGAPYDLTPVVEAKRDLEALSRISGDETLRRQASEMRDILARSDYEAGLLYFRKGNIQAGMRYMRAVRARYPKSEYAERARRIIELVTAAEAEER